MVILTNITDPEIYGCFKYSKYYGGGTSLLQVNHTVTTPRNILKAYDDDTMCKFLRSCMVFTIYIGCLPESSEYGGGCLDYVTRNEFLNMTRKYSDEFYLPALNITLDSFCMVIAPKVMSHENIKYLVNTEPCKYVKDLGMMEPYNDGRNINCLNVTDIRDIKKTIIY
uniref:Uncharacterized protein n=1 Tax=Apapanepox virus TaxID=3049969 RepID=A0AAT9UQJ7_9POXV